MDLSLHAFTAQIGAVVGQRNECLECKVTIRIKVGGIVR